MSPRSRDWRRVSEIRPDLPSSPATAFRIAVRAGWQRVAGERLAGRLPALERIGDCLVLAVPTRGWLRALPALEKRLVDRFADVPVLRGVRHLDGRLDERAGRQREAERRRAPDRASVTPADAGSARDRLEALARRLLERND